MSDPRVRARAPVRKDGYTLDDLRPLLVEPEQERLKSLEHKLETPEILAEAISEILPQASVMSQQHGEALSSAMQPLFNATIHETVRKDPTAFAEAIFPSIGPAIRKAVGSALAALVERLDDVVRRTMTVESLKWRIEAARTGRPFVEVMMLHNLVYRVEHVFLVHRESGLVLQHIAAKGVAAQDPDQVTAMLAAIDDFARDAFREHEGGLSRFRVGGLTGIVEQGPRAMLVAIVRGVATKDVETSFADTLERIHSEYADPLAQFKGQVTAFEPAREALLECMREEQKVQKPKNRRRGLLLLASIVLVAMTLASIVGVSLHRRHQRFAGYLEAVEALPGVTVTRTGRKGGRPFVEGLGDPVAEDPASLLASHGLGASDVDLRFDPVYSLDPRLTERHAWQKLRPPPGVSLRLAGDTLVAAGVAERAWIDRARLVATGLPGVMALDDARLFEVEAINATQSAAASLDRVEISFAPQSARILQAERSHLDAAARAAQELLASAPRGGLVARIELVGHTDATGLSEENQRLSEERAESVAAELGKRGVVAERLSARGVGSADSAGRRVTFAVHLAPIGEAS